MPAVTSRPPAVRPLWSGGPPHSAPAPSPACVSRSGRGALYRQTVLLSSFASAEMNALLARTCRNAAGKARLRPSHHGVLSHVIPQARQVFERLPAAVAEGGAPPPSDADARFEHFKRVLWPRIKESGRSGGHLVYIPSYFDYVRCGVVEAQAGPQRSSGSGATAAMQVAPSGPAPCVLPQPAPRSWLALQGAQLPAAGDGLLPGAVRVHRACRRRTRTLLLLRPSQAGGLGARRGAAAKHVLGPLEAALRQVRQADDGRAAVACAPRSEAGPSSALGAVKRRAPAQGSAAKRATNTVPRLEPPTPLARCCSTPSARNSTTATASGARRWGCAPRRRARPCRCRHRAGAAGPCTHVQQPL